MKRRLSGVLVLGFVLALAAPAAAQAETSADIRKVDTSRFPQVAVTISLPGTPSLSAGDIQIAENGNGASVEDVRPLGATGIDVVLAIDGSNSMRGQPIASAVAAAKRFIQGLPEAARVAIVSFANQATVLVPLTADRSQLIAALGDIHLQQQTALFDGVSRSASLFRDDEAQHNIVLLSDGANNAGVTDADGATAAAKNADATVFAIGFKGGATDVATLQQIADQTGGTYRSAQAANLTALYTELASGISDQYVVTYTSSARPGDQLNIQMAAAGNQASALVLAPKERVKGPIQPEVKHVQPLLRGTLGMLVAIVVTFVALFILAVMLIGTSARLNRERTAASRMKAVARPQAGQSSDDRGQTWIPQQMVEVAERVVASGGFGPNLEHKLEQSGLAFRAGEFLAAAAVAGLGGIVLGFLLFQNLFLALAVAVVAASGPWMVLSFKLHQRTAKLNAQLPDVLNILASSLRAGHSFLQALDTAAKDIPEPAAGEFNRTLAEVRLGRPLDEAMNAMAERVGSENFRWAVLAVNIQREVGGNLAEILDTVSNTVRERDSILREVQVLTTEGRLSMYILTALPIVFTLYLFLVRPEYVRLLYTTKIGLIMSVTAAALLGAGFVWFKKIVRIDV
jgi:tight adherence protein B